MFRPENEDTLIVYSEDPDLRGLTKKYCFTAYLVDYQAQTLDNFIEAAEIEFLDPCLNSPEDLVFADSDYNTSPAPVDTFNYAYDDSTLVMPMQVVIPTPSFCEITYECTID